MIQVEPATYFSMKMFNFSMPEADIIQKPVLEKVFFKVIDLENVTHYQTFQVENGKKERVESSDIETMKIHRTNGLFFYKKYLV